MSNDISQRFRVGQHVHVTGEMPFMVWDTGTVIAVIPGDGDTETRYKVRQFDNNEEREVETFPASVLEADDSGFLDIDSKDEIRAELASVCSLSCSATGLYATDPEYRIIAAGRISYLAGRLAWLEAADMASARGHAELRAAGLS